MFSKILLATDLGPCSDAATEMALELATRFKSQLTLVHVCEIPTYVYGGMGFSPVDLLTPVLEAAAASLATVLAKVQKTHPHATSVLKKGNPGATLLDAAEELTPDLIVIGTHGRRGPSHLLLGSVAETMVQRAEVAVLTVRSSRQA